jgi:hypothetical protein
LLEKKDLPESDESKELADDLPSNERSLAITPSEGTKVGSSSWGESHCVRWLKAKWHENLQWSCKKSGTKTALEYKQDIHFRERMTYETGR